MANVAVVVLDTLRRDAFERTFQWLPGRRFSRAYSTSHWTVPAHASLYTGRYASEVGVHGKTPTLDCPEPTLAESFQAAGYRTRCLTANPQMILYAGWDRGFDEFVGYESLPAYDPDVFDWGACFADLESAGYRRHVAALVQCIRSDCATIKSLRQGVDLFTRHDVDGGARDVRDRLRATTFADDGEFCLVNLMETHTPYYPPDDGEPLLVLAAEALAGEPIDFDRVGRAYRASVEYLSARYREIFVELADAFDYVITLSDHGELLGEEGLVNHSYGLFPELVAIPLVVTATSADVPTLDGVDDRVASVLDVHETVAELGDVDVDSRGQDLLGEYDPVDYGFEYHGLLPFHEAQFDRLGLSETEYDRRDVPLDGLVTPAGDYVYETHTDGLRTVGDAPSAPRERLDALVDSLDRRGLDETAAAGSDALADRLAALGYA